MEDLEFVSTNSSGRIYWHRSSWKKRSEIAEYLISVFKTDINMVLCVVVLLSYRSYMMINEIWRLLEEAA